MVSLQEYVTMATMCQRKKKMMMTMTRVVQKLANDIMMVNTLSFP